MKARRVSRRRFGFAVPFAALLAALLPAGPALATSFLTTLDADLVTSENGELLIVC